MCHRVVLNIRGTRFETFESTLQRFPNTLLGNPYLRQQYCNEESNEYYFDRSQYMFDTILFFYQSGGILAKPDHIDEDDYQDELRFFGIIKDFSPMNLAETGKLTLKQRLWLVLNFPELTIYAKIIAKLSLVIILISIVTYCMETTALMHSFPVGNTRPKANLIGILQRDTFWYALEAFYATWFSLEYCLRVISHPERMSFIVSVLGIVDVIAFVPYAFLACGHFDENEAALRTLKFLQIFRILKLSRYSNTLQLLGKSLFYCKGQISIILVFFLINCLVCGSILYWIERTSSTTSFMDTIYFCIVSMTTVGYGDIVPKTPLGKIFGTVIIIIGIVILFHMFIPVYISYFALLYEISVVQGLEKSENEKQPETRQEEDIKRHRRKSVTSNIRKSRSSMAINPFPSVSATESILPVRRSSDVMEDAVMRQVKYDYLRKISTVELSSLKTIGQKSLIVEQYTSQETLFHFRKNSFCTVFSDTPNAAETDENMFEYGTITRKTSVNFPSRASQQRGRRKAVYEQPTISREVINEHQQQILNRRPIRTFSCQTGSLYESPFETLQGDSLSQHNLSDTIRVSLQTISSEEEEGITFM